MKKRHHRNHRTQTARDDAHHSVNERKILRLEVVHVAKNVRLRVVRVPDRLGEDLGRAREVGGDGGGLDRGKVLASREEALRGGRRAGGCDVERVGELDEGRGGVRDALAAGRSGGLDGDEDVEKVDDVLERVALVERDADVVAVDLAKVDALANGLLVDDGRRGTVQADGEGVEEGLVDDLVTELLDASLDDACEAVDLLGDLAKSLGTVVDGVHGGNVGEESLGRADVARRLLATNVLLARLEGETVRRSSLGVLGQSDQASRHPALERVGAGEEGSVGSSVCHRDSETSAVSERHVSSPLSGRSEDRAGEEVGGAGDESTELVGAIRDRLPVGNLSSQVGVLEEDSDEVLLLSGVSALCEELLDVADDDLDSEGSGAGLNDGEGLGEDASVDEEGVLGAPELSVGHDHRFSGGGAFVEERGVGDVEAGEGGGETLEVDEGLEATWSKSCSQLLFHRTLSRRLTLRDLSLGERTRVSRPSPSC